MQLIKQAKEWLYTRGTSSSSSRFENTDYLAQMCHEIGTPLSSIIGLSHILSNGKCSEQKKSECAEMLRDSSHMLMELLSDLLDSSKLKAGKMEIAHTHFNLAKIIEEAVHIVALKAEEKGLALQVHISRQMPDDFMGDPLRIRQIVVNLLANAVKFTEAGHITLYVNSMPSSPKNCIVSITVADSGIGMNEAEIQKIFEHYVQANAHVSRNHGGSGLGLSISQGLAHLMQGEITVKSWPGIGSHFRVTVPLEYKMTGNGQDTFDTRQTLKTHSMG